MKLSGQIVRVVVNEAGREVIALANLGLPDLRVIPVSVQESEDLGLWIKVSNEEEDHLFLLMWHFIDAIDAPTGSGKLIGLRGSRPLSQ